MSLQTLEHTQITINAKPRHSKLQKLSVERPVKEAKLKDQITFTTKLFSQ